MWTLVFCMLFSGGVIPLFLAVQRYGLINSVWSLVLAGGLPVFNTILIVNFFRNLPPSLEEAACVDGAGVWRVFFQIFLPLSGPVIATVTLFMVMGHWNEFFHGLIFTTKQAKYPLQTYIQQMVVTVNISQVTDIEQLQKQAMLNNKSLDAAKIFIAMIPVLVVYPFLQRYFVTGITLGSVKE
jgi:multiple sugar transport system permease protein/putative aldouronate transport system permease protein